ncbi:MULTISPECIES: lamin tail domain-containing protein [Pseudoalteromonas]|uniref:Lamin tail domain-containing protein n=1 Tax=Pseudoalteromonas obscura TaxID=3048491 RepID=A0ABT7ET00_9GAMM|nr:MULTISPECIES: lamin tail domain-containing protein [Pseudoalteromonas]MBQ4839337.1 lamin tail domain-containing protein [Pseudoalteromonas luteoviolacea]MDK2598178.1 lamin tail domain-containing protein [Pseudoalteromonas sp. P94(2023)]
MDAISKMSLIELSSHFSALKGEEVCWPRIEKMVSDTAKSWKQSGKAPNELSVMHIWWHTCYELLAPHQIQISALNYRDEYIEIKNIGPAIIDLSGWSLNAGDKGQDFTFAKDTLIYPKEILRIETHPGSALSFESKAPIWNNQGDKAELKDKDGAVISTWLYGDAAHEDVQISQVNFDGLEAKKEGDEFVEVANNGSATIDLTGWQLVGDKGQLFAFHDGALLKPAGIIRIYTNQYHPSTGGHNFESAKALWSNRGGHAAINDYRQQCVSEYHW